MSPPPCLPSMPEGEAHCTQLGIAVGSRPDTQLEEPQFHLTEMKFKNQLKKVYLRGDAPACMSQLLEISHF